MINSEVNLAYSEFFQDWAVCSYNDDTGLGSMAVDIKACLGVGYQLVVPSERLTSKATNPLTDRWLPKDASREYIKSALINLKGIILLERANWHPELLSVAKELGVYTVCVPMWEWFNGNSPEWKLVDLFACPSVLTEKIVQSYGFWNTCHLTWPLDLAKLPKRYISGPARHFIHNSGLVDHDDRKGVRETIIAFSRLRREDVRLTVRLQKEVLLPSVDSRVSIIIGNYDTPYALYSEGDICVQPSKMEGLGFMVLEPVCSGIPVITTDYPPMNQYVQQPELRCKTKWFKRKAFASNWIRHAHLRLPNIRDLTRKMAWAASNDLQHISTYNRKWAEATFSHESLRSAWIKSLMKRIY
jgi:glycosyltransferase involved in cell wall biosynthesis